eukprot:747204-Pleurochrysis_carterae.AAC.1
MAFDNRRKRGATCRELLRGPPMLKVKRGTRSSDEPRAAAKVRSENHGTGRAGTATVKTVVLIRAGGGVEDSSKGCPIPSRQATRPEEELLSGEEGFSKAVEVMQLGKDVINEV